MGAKSTLKKYSELAEIVLYSQVHPWFWAGVKYERRKRLIDKHRKALTENCYFTGFIEPLVLRLHEHAINSSRVERSPCEYKGTTFVYTVRGKPLYPILTMGSEDQLQEICKKECYTCPTTVYNPLAVAAGLLQLTAFEISRVISGIKKSIFFYFR